MEGGLAGGAAGEGTQDGVQEGGAGREARDVVKGDEAVLHTLAQADIFGRHGQAGGIEVDGPWPGDADDEVEALHRVADLLPDLAQGGLVRRLVGVDHASEDGPAAGEDGPRQALTQVRLGGAAAAKVEKEAAAGIHQDDADAVDTG